MNKELVDERTIFAGRPIKVHDWRNNPCTLNSWAKVRLDLGSFDRNIICLVMENVAYDLLVARPLMKMMRLNLHYDDTISFEGTPSQEEKSNQVNFMRNIEDLSAELPNVLQSSLSNLESSGETLHSKFKVLS